MMPFNWLQWLLVAIACVISTAVLVISLFPPLTLASNAGKMNLPYGSNMLGGAFMVNKKAYVNSGRENERYYGWGPEDGERFHRWKNLGFKVVHSFGNLYHLSHPRGINSSFRSSEQARFTRHEVLITQQSSKEELLKSIEGFN